MKRFHTVNSELMRQLRLSRGWSQKELARIAGYSDRLVRKAELGGTLDIETIQDIAEALSTDLRKVNAESLIQDILWIARRFVSGYDSVGREMAPLIEPYVSADFVFHVAGDPTTAPFIGDWRGMEGFQTFLDTFFGLVSRTANSLSPTYSVAEDSVIARYVDTLFVAN